MLKTAIIAACIVLFASAAPQAQQAAPVQPSPVKRTILQKTDVRHATFVGAGLGVLIGAALGVALKLGALDGYVSGFDVGTVIVCAIAGLLLGAWCATLIGVSTPSVKLKDYERDFEAGRILLMVDVPHARVTEVQQLLHRRHPEAADHGIDLTMPAFP